MFVRAPDGAPHEEYRNRKNQRFGDDPGKPEALPSEPGIDLANGEGADDPELHGEPSPQRSSTSAAAGHHAANSGSHVLARTRDQQPGNPIDDQAAHDDDRE